MELVWQVTLFILGVSFNVALRVQDRNEACQQIMRIVNTNFPSDHPDLAHLYALLNESKVIYV